MKTPAFLFRAPDRRSFLSFNRQVEILTATSLEEVRPLLRNIEARQAREGLWAAGFVSYEATPAFDNVLTVLPKGDLPLAWFILCEEPTTISEEEAFACSPSDENAAHTWQPSVSEDSYRAAIDSIHEHIAAGATYQVNYTFRLRRAFRESPRTTFAQLAAAQDAPYAAFVETDAFAIASASPELFFEQEGARILTRPMKGTAARGLSYEEDEAQRDWLATSEKNRAENAMIVDMIRNDLGRVADFGSVTVKDPFTVEQYPTVWQMTSSVEGNTDAGLDAIFAALFPCASITGAPKAKTMEIIADLEDTPRQIYTGAIGWSAPDRRACFSVAIRTMLIDRQQKTAEYGVGGGIVWDSTGADEYQECLLKARVLTTQRETFHLLESLLWSPDEGLFLLEEHLDRLLSSAEYFDFQADRTAIIKMLNDAVEALQPKPHKVRLLVDRNEEMVCEAAPIVPPPSTPAKLAWSPTPVQSNDVFLYHKTTRRSVYEAARAAQPNADETVLYNERDEVTEATTANLVARIDGKLVTPPISSGLLGGTFRRHLIESGEVAEQVITRDELRLAENIYVINSVRRWREAVLVD